MSTATVDTTGPRTRTLRPARGRMGIVLTILLALVASGIFQQWAYSFRHKAVTANRPQGAAPPSRLANLDSFSLALLLGGLRGPLVMFLWTSSETQKSEKDLESFDTQVEMIRLLQPEFASVHLFQMWNKAYNISVQMASLANKYASILDAIQYGERTDRFSPDDLNILMTIGSLYADKLGNSAEKEYYRKRVRTETLPVYRVSMPAGRVDAFRKALTQAGFDESRVRISNSPDGKTATATLEKLAGDRVMALFSGAGIEYRAVPRQTLRTAAHGGRRTEMDTLLDAEGKLRREVVGEEVRSPAKELHHLQAFEPFSYGISPIALGYNYYKRGQILQAQGSQRHIQLSELVVDNQSAISLKAWAEEELDRGRNSEFAGLAKASADADKLKRDLRTASLGAGAGVADEFEVRQAIFSYGKTIQVGTAALPEYQRHIERFPQNLQNYRSHMDDLRAEMLMAKADALVLRAVLAKDAPAERQELVNQAKDAYAKAANHFRFIILHYYVEDMDAREVGYDRQKVAQLSPQENQELFKKVAAHFVKRYENFRSGPHFEDREEYHDALDRIEKRVAALGGK